eukprot:1145412-Pelagomonas_calceolata.AAC.4
MIFRPGGGDGKNGKRGKSMQTWWWPPAGVGRQRTTDQVELQEQLTRGRREGELIRGRDKGLARRGRKRVHPTRRRDMTRKRGREKGCAMGHRKEAEHAKKQARIKVWITAVAGQPFGFWRLYAVGEGAATEYEGSARQLPHQTFTQATEVHSHVAIQIWTPTVAVTRQLQCILGHTCPITHKMHPTQGEISDLTAMASQESTKRLVKGRGKRWSGGGNSSLLTSST